jgi:hypothetical protein
LGHGLGSWLRLRSASAASTSTPASATACSQQWVETRRGLRLRTVNVCAY